MANIFISHSSKDKPFVRKLASSLLSEGFPIWLDSWELELGDSIVHKIYEGIETSSFVIVVISENSIESGWVDRELNAAIAKELQVGRKFLIPIKVDSCVTPLKIADRIYADFSSEFSRPISQLVRHLVRHGNGIRDILPVPEKELVCVSFFKEVHLDSAQFDRRRKSLSDRQRLDIITANQIVVNDDVGYEILKTKLHSRIDNFESDPYFSPDLKTYLQYTLNSVIELEAKLLEGLALMINNYSALESVEWFCRILRGQAVYSLWSAQFPNAPDNTQYGRTWQCASLSSNSSAAEFFETDNVDPVHIWTDIDSKSNPYSIWIGKEKMGDVRDNEGMYLGPLLSHSLIE